MKKYLFILAAGAVALYSCSVAETNYEPISAPNNTSFTVGLVNEIGGIEEEETKAYLNQQNETVWNYVWEDGDEMGYFQFRNGSLRNQGRAEVDKRPTGTNVIYPTADFRPGDAIYAYMYQPEAEAMLAEQGIVNNDPYNMWVHIPTTQYTSTEPEIFSYSEDLSFQIGEISMTEFPNVSKSGSSYKSAIGFQAPAGTIKFKIKNYKRNLEYGCTGGTNLIIDYYGNAQVTVQPLPIDEDHQTSQSTSGITVTTKYLQTYPVDIFVVGHENKPANITVKAEITHKTGILNAGLVTPSIQITYTKVSTDASVIIDELIQGDVKPYPVRDCMPCVSKQFALNSSVIEYPEDIQANMTMYMLGSVIEFRVFSTDNNIAVGENLVGVFFNASDNCAGNLQYNIVGSDLGMTGGTESFVSAFDEEGKIIRNGKDNYVSLYMVVAPGDYSADVNFITTEHVYTFHMASKTFSRAVKKALNCNVSLTSCDCVSFNEFFGLEDSSSTEDGEGEDEDM